MIIGSHVCFKDKQLLDSVKEAISYDANALMLYTGAPQNSVRKKIDSKYTNEATELLNECNIKMENVICHAPYIINLANKEKELSWNFSINFLKQEIKRCEELNIKYIVLHPGSSVKLSKEEGINNIIEGLNYVIDDNDKCMILLETMAGKGTECGSSLEEINNIIKGVNGNIGVCLDTCHLNDAGYDISKFDEILDKCDNLFGIDKIKCVHLNDSKNVLGSHKDRHENIGYGTIGFDNLLNVVNNERIKDVPKILETPYVYDKTPYKEEIDMLRKGMFIDFYKNL